MSALKDRDARIRDRFCDPRHRVFAVSRTLHDIVEIRQRVAEDGEETLVLLRVAELELVEGLAETGNGVTGLIAGDAHVFERSCHRIDVASRDAAAGGDILKPTIFFTCVLQALCHLLDRLGDAEPRQAKRTERGRQGLNAEFPKAINPFSKLLVGLGMLVGLLRALFVNLFAGRADLLKGFQHLL